MRADPADEAPAVRRCITFRVAGEALALPVEDVKEAVETRPIARLFLVPDFIAGVVNLRGDVLAVLDLARLLGLDAPAADAPAAAARRILVLRGRNATRPAAAGLLVDGVGEVRDLDLGALRPVPATVPPDAAAFLRGLARDAAHPLLVLDLERVLDCERLRPLRRRA